MENTLKMKVKGILMTFELSLKNIIKNAKSAAFRDGYDQVIYKETDGTYAFKRLYKGCIQPWENVEAAGRIKEYYKLGVQHADCVPIEEDIEYEY